VGFAQFLLAQSGVVFNNPASGDDVIGTTFARHSHLYAVKMLFQGVILLYCWNYARERRLTWANPKLLLAGAAAAFVAGVFASFITGMVVFFPTVAAWWLWTAARGGDRRAARNVVRTVVLVVGAVIVMGVLFVVTQPDNARLLEQTVKQAATMKFEDDPDRFQRVLVFQQSIEEILLENPKNATVGLGLGMYSSRAAMILSGGYLYDQPDWLPVSMSEETRKYIYPLWNPERWAGYEGSTMALPSSTAQAVLLEAGVIGTALMLILGGAAVRRAAVMRRAHAAAAASLHYPALRLVTGTLLAFLALSVTELWLEHSSFSSIIFLFVAVALSDRTVPAPVVRAARHQQARRLATQGPVSVRQRVSTRRVAPQGQVNRASEI
jgi:hypothetical protein